MQILLILKNSIKEKIAPIWTKLKKWTDIAFLKNEGMKKLQEMIKEMLDVTPKNKEDYYTIGRYLVSKRLAYLIILALLLFCIWCIGLLKPVRLLNGEKSYRTYKYNAIPLKFCEDTVEILGKSGYTAYIGQVKDGGANGYGTLYDPSGNIVYAGMFEDNSLQGQGRSFYESGGICHEGNYDQNEYDGEGISYRENGTKEYEGTFSQGLAYGEGKLYDQNGNLVYTGEFRNGTLLYEAFPGSSTKEISEAYSGKQMMYFDDEDQFCTVLEGIDVVYYGNGSVNSLEEDWAVGGIYVLKDSISFRRNKLTKIEELTEAFGEPEYEGNTNIIFSDAVAIHVLDGRQEAPSFSLFMDLETVFEDAVLVKEFDSGFLVYIYRFLVDENVYTFFCNDRNDGFFMYLVEGV